MEKHFWAHESFVPNINVYHVSSHSLVHKLLEFVRLNKLTCRLVHLFVVVRIELLEDVLADVPILLFHFRSNFVGIACWNLLATVLHHLQGVVSDVAASQWDVLHARRDNVAVADREDVSNTVASVDHSASHIRHVPHVSVLGLAFLIISLVCDLRVQGQSRLDADKKSLDVECLKHDLRHLLSILWSVHGWLCQDESVFLRVTPQVGVDGLVPELLDTVPVCDLAALEQEADIVSLFLALRLLANVEVELRVVEQIFLESCFLNTKSN